MIFIVLIVLILAVLFFIFFVSKRFSPVPYFPTQRTDLPLIIKSLDLKNSETLIDLGAGDGIVIFEAAKKAFDKKLNTKFIAVDINPILIIILYIRRLFHPNKKNITIFQGDFFKMDFKLLTFNFKLLTFYLYISPWFLNKVSKRILADFPNARIVSYMYPIKSLRKREREIKGNNSIFVYI